MLSDPRVALHLTQHRGGFGRGTTDVTRFDEADDTGIAMSVVKLDPGERFAETARLETAWLLMTGEADILVGMQRVSIARRSIFDELPWCVHVSRGEPIAIEATSAGPSSLTNPMAASFELAMLSCMLALLSSSRDTASGTPTF